MKIEKTFYIQVYEDGRQYPCIKIHQPQYEMMYDLASGHLATVVGVKKEISKIREVLSGELKEYSFSGSDWCIIQVNIEHAILVSGFDEFESVKISTQSLVEFLLDWCEFLIKYENNEIPGITKS